MDFIVEAAKPEERYKQGTFMWAVAQMKEGKKVRRKKWLNIDDKNYWFIKEAPKTIGEENIYSPHLDEPVQPFIDSIEATDWEIYEEKDTWNLADEIDLLNKSDRNKGMDFDLIKEYFKTFIQKVKEDIDNSNSNAYFEEGCGWRLSMLHKGDIKKIIDKRAGGL